MKLNNLHQPYIFKHNDNINIIVSEFTNQRFSFKFGEDDVFEDYWKLCLLDSSYKKITINTPTNIFFENENYEVIAECNGFFYENKLSYVIGVHKMENHEPLKYFLVETDFDIDNNIVSNFTIKDKVRTGFFKTDKYVLDVKSNDIIKNDNITIFDCSPYLDNVVRIIPIYNENKIIFTGQKDNVFNTLVINVENNEVKKIEGLNQSEIYKSSIFDDGINKLFAYTDKVFVGETQVDYILNIENDYVLINQ
jgi:hypothetical protein